MDLTEVALAGALEEALARVPAGAGVGQLVGPEGRNLVIGRAANLRRWAASHLGGGPAPRKGARPRTDLRPVAVAVRHQLTRSAFHQRLVYERLMAAHVPLSARRDLKPPLEVWLDFGERFPRLLVKPASTPRPTRSEVHAFGPFRDRPSAQRTVAALEKRLLLRPCDYTFEPHPELALGLGCVYAQMKTCAAPCLQRTSEEEYRALARRAAAWLGGLEPREDGLAPPWVGERAGSLALIVDWTKDAVDLFPVAGTAVLDARAVSVPRPALGEAVAGLRFEPAPAAAPDDWPWLLSWLTAPKKAGAFLVLPGRTPPSDLGERVQAALASSREAQASK